jgi:hypothetical protein
MKLFRVITIIGTLPCLAVAQDDEQAAKQLEELQKHLEEVYGDQIKVSKLRHAVLDAANRTEIPHLKDFLILYPDAVVRYLSFAKSDFPGLSVTTTLHDRYKFNLRVPVRYSEDNQKIIGYGEPMCHLLEIASVTPRDDGAGGAELHATSGGDLQEHFGLKDWKKLVESKGDFSTLGFKLKVTNPVPNFNLIKKDLKSLERQIPKQAEQDGADQPATAPESKPESDSKQKPESEVRPQ